MSLRAILTDHNQHFPSLLSAPDFHVTSASQTPCRSWWTRAKLPLSLPASLSSPGLLSWRLTPTCSVTKKPRLMWVRRTADDHFSPQQCTWSALFMKICSLVVWADTRSGPEVSGRVVSHRSVQLADSGRPDWQAARGSVSVHVYFCSSHLKLAS